MARRLGTQLFVSRLSPYTTNQKLESLFSPFGVVKEARLVRDPKTQKPKGYGFVTFESEDEAQKALKTLDGRIVDGSLIFVEVAKTTEPRGSLDEAPLSMNSVQLLRAYNSHFCSF